MVSRIDCVQPSSESRAQFLDVTRSKPRKIGKTRIVRALRYI